MPTTWVVSTHGTSYGTATPDKGVMHQLVQLPAGVRVYFYEPEGVPLPVAKAWPIYETIMKQGKSAQDYVALSQFDGYEMFDKPALPNYAIEGDESWVDKHGQLASGIFKASDEFHQDGETQYVRNGEVYSLQEFFHDGTRTFSAGDQVYWLACRSWAGGGSPH